MPFFKFQEAGDPGLELPGANNFPLRGVKPAPVSHQGSPGRGCDKFAGGCDSILMRHE